MEYRKTIQEFKNGTNVNYIPILTPEEYAVRQEQVKRAAVNILKEVAKKQTYAEEVS